MNDSAPILVSACLLGLRCRYDGSAKADARVLALAKTRALIPVCPEQLGGLPTPRPPAERVESRVLVADGTDVSAEFARGAEETLRLAQLFGCKTAVLKARSPSCGNGEIYDGTFSGRITLGQGVTAALLQASGISVMTEADDLSDL